MGFLGASPTRAPKSPYGLCLFCAKILSVPYLPGMAKLVLNIERVGKKALQAQRVHDLRRGGDLEHVDPKRRSWNQVLAGSGDVVADVQGVLDEKKAKIRKDNEAPFTRFVLSASPEHFAPPGTPETIAQFAANSMAWLKKEYGDGLAYAVMHLDEKTPHIHAVVVPLYEKKTKRGRSWAVSHHEHEATKGFMSYEHLRRRAGEALGLEYGEPGNTPMTKEQREIQKALDQRHQAQENRQASQDAREVRLAHREAEQEAVERSQVVQGKALQDWEKRLVREAVIVSGARRAEAVPAIPEVDEIAARARRRPRPDAVR